MMVVAILLVACNSGETLLTGETVPVTEVEEPEPAGEMKPREDIVLTAAEKTVVAKNSVFALNLFRQVADEAQDDNLLVSPLSLSLALAMLNNGANGVTQEEIQTVLGYGDVTREEANGYFRKIIDALQELDTYVRFESANSIWIPDENFLLKAFQETNQTYFDAEALTFNPLDPEGAVKQINEWCSEKTNGLIPNLLSGEEMAMMYLLNALYFKGSWMFPFDEALTDEAPFYNRNGSTANLPTMQLTASLQYAKEETFELVELPYGNAAFDMTLLLPAENASVTSILEELDAVAWDNALAKLHWETIDIRLPRFKVEYSRSLIEDLKALGMTTVFSDADFSLISPTPLVISFVKQKNFLEVNEEGAEGTAATAIGMEVLLYDDGPEFQPQVVAFNRPFIYFIKEKSTGSIIFFGIIQNP